MRPRLAIGVALAALATGAIVAVVALRGANERAPGQGDHWHATYRYIVCGEVQPNAPTWEGVGIRTDGDGIIHMMPFTDEEEGRGARLVKWFEYGGGVLTDDEVRLPGQDRLYRNGDRCPEGSEGVVQVFLTTAATGVVKRLDDWSEYIPYDGDRVRIVFGPREEAPVMTGDRTIIPESQVTGEPITITVTDDGTEGGTRFEPNLITVNAGVVVKLVIKNTGTTSHGFRVIGADDEYDTQDDFVVTPAGADPETTAGLLQPGAEGVAIIRLDEAGEIEYRDDALQDKTGTIVVSDVPVVGRSPTLAPADQVDAEVSITLKDDAFEPVELKLPAAKKFRINIKNKGTLACNLRIAGPDGEYRTDDDIVSETVNPGNTGEAVGQIDTSGIHLPLRLPFRCDFRPELTGTVTVE
jgi:hypothetical protein